MTGKRTAEDAAANRAGCDRPPEGEDSVAQAAESSGHRRPDTSDRHAAETPAERLLLRVVDGSLAACIFVVPLLMGGRQALGQLALMTLAVTATLAWTLRQIVRREARLRLTSAAVLLVAAVALILLQMAPLPGGWLATLSPHTGEILPLWTAEADTADTGAAALGTWSTISMTPGATRAGLALLLAYALLFAVTLQRIDRVEDVERLLRWIAWSVLAMACFGLVQFLTSNGKFFWFYEHPFSKTSDAAKGSFTNRNHFAHFLALGIGPLIWWLQHSLRQRQPRQGDFGRATAAAGGASHAFGLRSIGVGIVLFAGLMSLSRGGMVMILLATSICVAVCYRMKTLSPRFVLSLGVAAVLIAAMLAIHGSDLVGGRLQELSSGSIDTIDQKAGRRTIWAAVMKAGADYRLLGSGVGSHREVYPMYLENPPSAEYTHAESGPLQLAEETGLAGLGLMLAAIAFCGYWCLTAMRRSESKRPLLCAGAIAAALAVSVAHSLADFVWYVPACMALVAMLAACACRLGQLASENAGGWVWQFCLPRYAPWATAAALVVIGGWMIFSRVGPTLAERHWDRYQILALASSEHPPDGDEATGDDSQTPADGKSAESLGRMIAALERVVRYDPNNGRAHLELASAYLKRFDLAAAERRQLDPSQQAGKNVMPLSEIRDATRQARARAADVAEAQIKVEQSSEIRDATRQARAKAAEEAAKTKVQEWLVRLIGGEQSGVIRAADHVRQGLRLCPLQGEGYLLLADLQFIDGPDDPQEKLAFIDQALRVRPYDGSVLFEAGRAAWLAGDIEQGTEYWQRSYRSGYQHKKRLIEALTGRVAVGYILETYQPGLDGLRLLHASYRRLGDEQQVQQLHWLYADLCRAWRQPVGPIEAAKQWHESELTALRSHFVLVARAEAETLEGNEAAARWMEAGWVCHLMQDAQQALDCANRAFECDPNDYDVRQALALRLVDQQQYDQAKEHVTWCLQRNPNDQRLQQISREVDRSRISTKAPDASNDQLTGILPNAALHSCWAVGVPP